MAATTEPTFEPVPDNWADDMNDNHMVYLPGANPRPCHPSALSLHKEDVAPNHEQNENPVGATPTAAAAFDEFPSAAATRERVEHQELLGGLIEPVGSASAMHHQPGGPGAGPGGSAAATSHAMYHGLHTPEQQPHPGSAAAFEQPAAAQSAAQNPVYPHDPSRVLFTDTHPQGQWNTYAPPGPYPADQNDWGHYPQHYSMQSMMPPNYPCQYSDVPPPPPPLPQGMLDQQCEAPPSPPLPSRQPSPPPSESESRSTSQTHQSPSRVAKVKILVQFNCRRKTRYLFEEKLPSGTHVIVEGDQGVDFGVVVESRMMRRKERPGSLQWIKRQATQEEASFRWGPLAAAEHAAIPKAQEILNQYGIAMTIVGAEFQFDRQKLTLHYVPSNPHADVRFKDALSACWAEWRCRIWFNKAA